MYRAENTNSFGPSISECVTVRRLPTTVYNSEHFVAEDGIKMVHSFSLLPKLKQDTTQPGIISYEKIC
jgi:hypothetical protein